MPYVEPTRVPYIEPTRAEILPSHFPTEKHSILFSRTPNIASSFLNRARQLAVSKPTLVSPLFTSDRTSTTDLPSTATKLATRPHSCDEKPVSGNTVNSEAPIDDKAALEREDGNSDGLKQNDGKCALGLVKEVHCAPHDDPFRGPLQIPGCSPVTFVYPYSTTVIPPAFRERYPEVLSIFRANTEEDPQLRDYVYFIDYTLRICGTSPVDAHPSIVVFCRPKEFKALSALLKSKALKYQYCLRKPKPSSSRTKFSWGGRSDVGQEEKENSRPFFSLYFWRQRKPRTLLRWHRLHARIKATDHGTLRKDDQDTDDPRHGLTLCGSHIEFLGREPARVVSTLGCVIKMGSAFLVTTSMHAFTSGFTDARFHPMHSTAAGSSTPPGCVSEPGSPITCGSSTDASDKCFDDDAYFIDDVHYESLDDDEDGDDSDQNNNGSIHHIKHPAITTNYHPIGNGPYSGEQSEPHSHQDVDLDWALLDLPEPQDWCPNAFLSPDTQEPVFLSESAEIPDTRETEVFILTDQTLPQRGMLQPGTSMLGGINGNTPSIVWTVIMDTSNRRGLKPGDSGSLVVDAVTNTIYGHVVGLNPLGEVYITSYAQILRQIQSRFPEAQVSIPEPTSTLKALADYYTRSGRGNQASATLRRLMEACNSMADSSEEQRASDLKTRMACISPAAARPALPRSSSYLTKHRRTPSAVPSPHASPMQYYSVFLTRDMEIRPEVLENSDGQSLGSPKPNEPAHQTESLPDRSAETTRHHTRSIFEGGSASASRSALSSPEILPRAMGTPPRLKSALVNHQERRRGAKGPGISDPLASSKRVAFSSELDYIPSSYLDLEDQESDALPGLSDEPSSTSLQLGSVLGQIKLESAKAKHNNGVNFQADFRKKHLPQNGKRPVGAASRPLTGLPKSNRRSNPSTAPRPKSMPVGSAEFGSVAKLTVDQSIEDYLGESEQGTTRLKGVKSSGSLPTDDLSPRLAAPSGRAFQGRYDFTASLTAALQTAKDQDDLYMKPHKRAVNPNLPVTKSPNSSPVAGYSTHPPSYDQDHRRLVPPSGNAFDHRYDFSASLTAALESAKASITAADSDLYMRPNKPSRLLRPHSDTNDKDKATMNTLPAPKSLISSSSYEALINKYCFYGSRSGSNLADGSGPTFTHGASASPVSESDEAIAKGADQGASPIQQKVVNPYFQYHGSSSVTATNSPPPDPASQYDSKSQQQQPPLTTGQPGGSLPPISDRTGPLLVL